MKNILERISRAHPDQAGLEYSTEEWFLSIRLPKNETMDGLSSEEDIRFRIYPDTKRELYELVIMNKDIVEFLLRMPECEYHHYPALHPSGGVRIDPAGMSKQGAQEALRVLHGAEEWIRGYGAKKNTGTWMMS